MLPDSRGRHRGRSPVNNLPKIPHAPGRLGKAGSLVPQEASAAATTQGQPLYRKGSGLASLAKFLANAQHLHGPEVPQHLPNKGAQAGNQTPTTGAEAAAEGSRPGSAQKWNAATGVVMSHEVARHVRYNVKLKALQHTPHHMIISRVRILLERLRDAPAAAPGSSKAVDEQDFVVPAWLSGSKPIGAAASPPLTAHKEGQPSPSRLMRPGSIKRADSSRKLAEPVLVTKDTSGSESHLLSLCSDSSTMDEFSMVDELSVILMFLNPFLAKLPEEAREGLCRRMSIESINRDHTIYKQGDEVPNFYLILSGIVEASSRRMGNRSKSLLKKGQSLGERAILEGEPAGETCSAGSPVLALIVNRQAPHKARRWCTIGAMQVYISMLTACDRVSIVCRHDFLGILEPYMMEEKKGLVDFLRTAVGCFRDLPRGHIISLAQHMQQVDHPEGTEFESSDTNVYFVKAGHVQLRAAEKQLEEAQVRQTVAQAAVAVQTMAATGPLSKVEIHDGQLIGTLGKQQASRKTLRNSSRLLSNMGPGTFFGSGSLLNGEGDLQAALVSCAASPVTLLVISIADFSKHATPDVLRVMRDEVCFRLTYYQGRAGLVGVDAVVGHSAASLGPGDKAVKKGKAKTSKRKAATQKTATSDDHSHACLFAGENAQEAEATTVEAIVQHYRGVQQSNAPLQASNAATRDKRTDSGEKYYSNGTPAERYWTSMGAENNSKRQNVSSLLQTIFPDGLAPLANKVAKIELKEQARAAKQAARQAAALEALDQANEPARLDGVTDRATGVTTSNAVPAQSSLSADQSVQQGGTVMLGRRSPVPLPGGPCMPEPQARMNTVSSRQDRINRRTSDAASAVFEENRKPHHKHYSHGQKLAASIMWEAASGKIQPVRLRQCLTYSEIQMKNLACAQLAQIPLARLDSQEPAYRLAQEV
ncbi:MAG: hypothetical protein FRX49_11101 [Trebouxia sp. A1-2]|nr:MAG: hypothetical protein FRX49_11101 [Trebouxia sp. A1-2]